MAIGSMCMVVYFHNKLPVSIIKKGSFKGWMMAYLKGGNNNCKR
jgi:hypothetical protein